MDVQNIIEKFGTQQALADAIDVKQGDVAGWKSRGRIPRWRHDAILKAAIDRRISLTRRQLEKIND